MVLDMVTETGLNLVLLVEELSTCSRKYVLLALASLIHFVIGPSSSVFALDREIAFASDSSSVSCASISFRAFALIASSERRRAKASTCLRRVATSEVSGVVCWRWIATAIQFFKR